jgi:hypothetical protein
MNTMDIQEKVYLLDATDRCDSCASQAYVKVIGNIGELLFCSHHYNKIMNSPTGYKNMMSFMVEIIDERSRLED